MAGLRWLLAALCVSALSSWTLVVSAQQGSTDEARQEYRRGMDAVREQRWADAEAAFVRAYELAPRPLILFNLAGAQLEGGRLVPSLETYRRFLGEDLDSSAARFRQEAERAVERLERIIPRVTIDVRGSEPGDEVRLDGTTLEADQVGEEVPVDPGEHVAEVSRGPEVLASESFSIGESERREIVLAIATPAVDAVPPEAFEPDARTDAGAGSSVFESPWLWIGVGLVIAGGIVAGVVIAGGDDAEQPHVGNLPPGGLRL